MLYYIRLVCMRIGQHLQSDTSSFSYSSGGCWSNHVQTSSWIASSSSCLMAFRASPTHFLLFKRGSRVVVSVIRVLISSRALAITCSIQNCAILSLTPVSVLIASTASCFPRQAVCSWYSIVFIVSAEVRGRPV